MNYLLICFIDVILPYSGTIPTGIGSLTALAELSLSSNALYGICYEHMMHFPLLSFLIKEPFPVQLTYQN